MATLHGFIGRIMEIRIDPNHEDEITFGEHRRITNLIISFRERGGGNFKLAAATTVKEVEDLLRIQLTNWLELKDVNVEFIQMRVNTNEINDGVCWEGFTVSNRPWTSASEKN